MAIKKTKTMDLQGKQYAQVQDRLIEFRTANPNALIETTPTIQEGGQILFKARVLKDKSDPNSAEATGHSLGETTKVKAFEKLETIAVGRALALLGYASSGEIASSEEMEEFNAYKKDREDELILMSKDRIEDCKTLEELKTTWAELPLEAKTALEELKDAKKVELSKPKKPSRAKKENENPQIQG